MRVDHLALDGFRRYAALEAEFPAGPQVVVGRQRHGQDKPARKPRRAGHEAARTAPAQTPRWSLGGPSSARLEAIVIGPERLPTQLEVVIALTASGGGRKRVMVNGVGPPPGRPGGRAAASSCSRRRTCCSSPARPPCAARRSTPSWPRPCRPPAPRCPTYARAMTQRNNLLRAIRDGLGRAGRAALLGRGRHRGWGAHRRLAARQPWRSWPSRWPPRMPRSPRPRSGSSCATRPTPSRWPTRRRVTRCAAAWRRRRDKEQWNGATLIGPHRDDVVFASARARPGRLRLARSAAHGHPGLQAGPAGPARARRWASRRCFCWTTSSPSSTQAGALTSCGASASCPRHS